jgi:predicted regulator of Ras-like GTPase activity (Roadblock/LC7/MglB family)
MVADLARTVEGLVQAVRHCSGAILMGMDGIPVEQVVVAPGTDLEAIAGEYAGLLHEVRALASELECGAAQRFTVRAMNHRVVFAFAEGDLVLGVQAASTGLSGQIRYAISRAMSEIGEL